MEAFGFHSGMQNVEKAEMAVCVSYFVQGLRTEIRQRTERNVVRWQAKPLDELLWYANYYMDEEEAQQRQVKEKPMAAQTALVQGTISKMQDMATRGGIECKRCNERMRKKCECA